MKKGLWVLLAMLLLTSLLISACNTNTNGGTPANSSTGTALSNAADKTLAVTDLLGRTVTVPANPHKFVAVGPGCLRLYCYVGDVSKIVGVEQMEVTNGASGRPYAMANPDLLKLPLIGPGGPGNAPDPEKILGVNPDVIFTLYNSDTASVDELQSKTHIPAVSLSYGNTEVFDPAVNKSLELIGKITGKEQRAAEIIQFFSKCQTDLNNRTKDIASKDKPRVYLGAQSFRGNHGIESTSGIYSLFSAVNVRNAAAEVGITTSNILLDKEKLLDMNPDIIFLDAGGLALVQKDYQSNPQFYHGLSAFKNGKVYLQLPYNFYYTNIDVALCDAYYIGTIVFPDKFKDVDIVLKSNEIFKQMLGKDLYAEVAKENFGGFQQLSFK
jgi:iron complex transport system substrate-binding protein